MGGYITKFCCTDKELLLASEQISSMINSSSILISEYEDDIKDCINNQIESEFSPELKNDLIKRRLSNIENIDSKESSATPGITEFKRAFRRSFTLNLSNKSGFLQRAKQKLRYEQSKYSEEVSPIKEELTLDGSLSTGYRSLFFENFKNSDAYIIRPDGDWDIDITKEFF